MQTRNLTIFLGSLVVLIIVTALYLGSPTPTPTAAPLKSVVSADQAGAWDTASTGPGSRPTEGIMAKKPELQAHPSQTAKIDPQQYSSFANKPEWEKDIIHLHDRLDLDDTDKAVSILKKMDQLPHEGKVMAMDYATRLIPDDRYVQLRPWLFQLGTTDELRETIMLDALTRADGIRFSTLVEMLRQPKNPGQEEVKEILVAYLDEDHGDDLQKWDAAVKKFLIENPEE